MAELNVNGVRLSFDDVGTGGPPFVFVHGWACDRTAWAPQVESLSRDYRCVSIDLRGRGGSEALPPYDASTAADDIAVVIQALAIAPAIVVGHSLGGLVALLLNDRHPELVQGIVLGDSPLTAAQAGRFAPLVHLQANGSMTAMAPLVERFFVEATPADVRDRVLAMMLSCPTDVAVGMLENAGVFQERMVELLREADRKPFMAIWGARPLGSPEQLREVAPFVRQEPMAETGHFFQLEQPAITNALLRAFVDDVLRDPRIAAR